MPNSVETDVKLLQQDNKALHAAIERIEDNYKEGFSSLTDNMKELTKSNIELTSAIKENTLRNELTQETLHEHSERITAVNSRVSKVEDIKSNLDVLIEYKNTLNKIFVTIAAAILTSAIVGGIVYFSGTLNNPQTKNVQTEQTGKTRN